MLTAIQPIDITLTFSDFTTRTAKVSKLSPIITYKGNTFIQQPRIALTHYHQVESEDLSNIEIGGKF